MHRAEIIVRLRLTTNIAALRPHPKANQAALDKRRGIPSHTRARRTARPYQERPCSTASSPSMALAQRVHIHGLRPCIHHDAPDEVVNPHSFSKISIASYSPLIGRKPECLEVHGCTRKTMAHLRLSWHPCLNHGSLFTRDLQ